MTRGPRVMRARMICAWMGLRLRGRNLRPVSSVKGHSAPANHEVQYAMLAAAALHGGTEPDLLDEVAWWQSDDFW
jgi:hypothetical protein